MKSRRVSKNREVGVYEPQTPSASPPDRFISLNHARNWVGGGEASWINRTKAIRLKHASGLACAELPHGESSKPGPRLVIAYSQGEHWAKAAIDGVEDHHGWAPVAAQAG